MGKGSKTSRGKQLEMKERALNRVDDLQGMFSDLQSARKESRSIEVAVLEEQVHQMLKEWKSELNRPSPASSLQAGSLGSFSSEIYRLLHLGEEEDDATSALAASKPEPDAHKVAPDTSLLEDFNMNQGPERQEFQLTDYCQGSVSAIQNGDANALLYPSQLEYHHSYNLHQNVEQNYSGFIGPLMYGEDAVHHQVFGYLPHMCPPPSAFLGPKCSLWDCTRPAQEFDYCSSLHAALALKEGPPGMTPVLRPGGICLKDGLLFAVLNAKAQGKGVGVPECEGAATTKSPWNAPELFDLTVLEGETIREWLFFDKPRRAFESGTRKQRSLPDYNGRGWHESRKQVMNEFNGLKRSYYMDPQPRKDFEWHLYEYEINNFDACALYRLEFKRVDGKKNTKGKSPNDTVADLQKQMGKLTAEFPIDNKRSVKGRTKASPNDDVYSVSNQGGQTNEGFDQVNDYLVADLNGYYLT